MISRKVGKKCQRRRYTPEQIITKLREAEVLQSQGMSVEEAARILEIAPQTYYRWRKEFGYSILNYFQYDYKWGWIEKSPLLFSSYPINVSLRS